MSIILRSGSLIADSRTGQGKTEATIKCVTDHEQMWAEGGPLSIPNQTKRRKVLQTMDAYIQEVLVEYEVRFERENTFIANLMPEEIASRRDELLVCVGRATGLLLNLLARESRAQSLLELGTGYGYSTIWLADAARATGGRVVTIDTVAQKQQYAKAAVQRAGLRGFVQFQLRDALDFLASTRKTYDFVLVDLWKDLYVPCIDALLDRLEPGATIVADNMLKPNFVRLSAAKYQAHVRKIAELQTVVLPVGSGLAISRYHP